MPEQQLHVRCGDADGYNNFDDLESAIDYLQEMRVKGPLEKINSYQFESPSMGKDTISMFWAVDPAYPEKKLTQEELHLINLALPIADPDFMYD